MCIYCVISVWYLIGLDRSAQLWMCYCQCLLNMIHETHIPHSENMRENVSITKNYHLAVICLCPSVSE